MTAWKDLERRVCVALGGRRGGPIGAAVSDCVGVPYSVEIKRTKRPPMQRWLLQARQQSKREGNPWLLVVAGHNDHNPIAILDFTHFVSMAQQAGHIPKGGTMSEPSSEPLEPAPPIEPDTEPAPEPEPDTDEPTDDIDEEPDA